MCSGGVRGLDYPFAISRQKPRIRRRPSSLYTFPSRGLARDRLGREPLAFPDFERFYSGGFPPGTPIEVCCVYRFRHVRPGGRSRETTLADRAAPPQGSRREGTVSVRNPSGASHRWHAVRHHQGYGLLGGGKQTSRFRTEGVGQRTLRAARQPRRCDARPTWHVGSLWVRP